MAIVLNPGQRDPFGGPAGGTRDAMQMILQGIMQGAEKRKQNKQNQLLSSMFSEQTGEQGPPRSPDMFIESLFANPELTPQSKATGVQYMAAKSDIDLARAQAEKARAGEPPKMKELKIWNPDGTPGRTLLVPESQYNAAVDKLDSMGYRTAEPTDQLTGEAKNLEVILGRKPTLQDYIDWKKSGGTEVNVGVNLPAQEEKFRENMGKFYAEEFGGMQKEAKEAQANTYRLDRAKSLVTRINTGKLKPTTNTIKAVLKDLGGGDLSQYGLSDDVGLSQALEAVTTDLTMDTVARTKGAVSDKEMELFARTAPQLSNTVDGNLLIIEMSQKLNENKIKVADLARKYMAKNKRFDEGFYDELQKFYEENPLFTDDIYAKVNQLTGASKEARNRGIVSPPSPDFKGVSNEDLLKQLQIGK